MKKRMASMGVFLAFQILFSGVSFGAAGTAPIPGDQVVRQQSAVIDDHYENDGCGENVKLTKAQEKKLDKLYDKLYKVKKELVESKAQAGILSVEQKDRHLEMLKKHIEYMKQHHCHKHKHEHGNGE